MDCVCVCVSPTLRSKVEERWVLSAVGQFEVGVAQLVEEGVGTGLQRRQAGRGRVLQQPRAQRDRLRGRTGPEHLHSQSEKSTETDQPMRELHGMLRYLEPGRSVVLPTVVGSNC